MFIETCLNTQLSTSQPKLYKVSKVRSYVRNVLGIFNFLVTGHKVIGNTTVQGV